MGSGTTPWRRLGLALLWWTSAAAIVAAAGVLAAGVALTAAALAGSEVGEVQRAVWLALARGIAGGALAPVGGLTVVAWLGLSALRPALDARWRALGLGVPALAALGFAPVGAWGFAIWTPRTPWDVLGTGLLVSGGVSAALLLARRLVPPLSPGALAGARRREAAPPT